VAFRSDFQTVMKKGVLTLHEAADGALWADTVADAAVMGYLTRGFTRISPVAVDDLLLKASGLGLGIEVFYSDSES
jgi:hypothetical protein